MDKDGYADYLFGVKELVFWNADIIVQTSNSVKQKEPEVQNHEYKAGFTYITNNIDLNHTILVEKEMEYQLYRLRKYQHTKEPVANIFLNPTGFIVSRASFEPAKVNYWNQC